MLKQTCVRFDQGAYNEKSEHWGPMTEDVRHRSQQSDFTQISNAYTNVHVSEDHAGDDYWDPSAYDIHGNRINAQDAPIKKWAFLANYMHYPTLEWWLESWLIIYYAHACYIEFMQDHERHPTTKILEW